MMARAQAEQEASLSARHEHRRRSLDGRVLETAVLSSFGMRAFTGWGNLPSLTNSSCADGRAGACATIHVDAFKAVHSMDMMQVEEELRSVRAAIAVLEDKVSEATSHRVHCILILQEANGAAGRLEQSFHATLADAPLFIKAAVDIKCAVGRGGCVVEEFGHLNSSTSSSSGSNAMAAAATCEVAESKLVLSAFQDVIAEIKAFTPPRRQAAASLVCSKSSGGAVDVADGSDAAAVGLLLRAAPRPSPPSACVLPSVCEVHPCSQLDACMAPPYDEAALSCAPSDELPVSTSCVEDVAACMTSSDDYTPIDSDLELQHRTASTPSPCSTSRHGEPVSAAAFTAPFFLRSGSTAQPATASGRLMRSMSFGMLPCGGAFPSAAAVSRRRASPLLAMLDLSLAALSMVAAVERRDGQGCQNALAGLQERMTPKKA